MDPNYIVFLISELLTSELAKTFGRDLINIVASKGIVLGSRYLWQKCINDQDSFSLDEYEQFKQVHPDIANYEGFKKTLAKVCNDLASKITRTPSKDLTNPEALVQLLGDWVFHDLLAKWIISVTPEKREEAKAEVIDELVKSLEGVGVDRNPAERAIDILLEQFAREFDDNSVLRGWKVPLQIDYMVSVLGEQEAGLRKINGMLHYLMYGKVPQKTIHSIMERYQCYLLKECSNIISPITMSLEDFYVELPLEVEERPLLFTGEGDMQEGKATRRVDTKDLLQESNCIAILGNSGTGKSTLLNWLAYVNIVPYMNFPDGVVLIRCRELDQRVQQGSMEDILKSHFGRLFSSKEAEMLALYSRNRLEEGKVLLLLDGLDELKNDRETRRKFFENAIELSRRCPHSKIVMTSRTAAYQEICECVKPEFIPRVKKAQFQGLKIQDKKKLIEVWAGKKNMKKQGEKLLNLLTENCEINLITDTPLMFSLLLLIFQESEMSLPQNKAELYDKALTKLLEERKEHPHDASFTKSEIFPLLEYLALVMSRKERLQIEESEIIKLFDDFHRNLKQTKYEYIPVENGSNIKIRESVRYKESSYIINDAKDFLSKLKYSSSLFLLKEEISEKKNSERIWEFRHLGYQEYLSARAIVDQYWWEEEEKEENKRILNLAQIVEEHENLIESNKAGMWQNIVRMSICIYKNDNKKLEEGSEKEKQRKKNNDIINYAIGQFISFNNRRKNVFTFNNFLVQCLLDADHVYENNIHSAITSIAKLPFFHYSDDKEKIRFIYDVEKSLANLFFKKFKESIGKYIYDNIEYVFDAKCAHHIPFRARFIFENSLIDHLKISQKENQEIIRILDSLFKKTARNKNSDNNDVEVLSFMFLIHRLLPVIFWDDQNVDNLNSGNIKNKIIRTGLLTKLFERIKYGQEELPYYICFSLAGIGNPLFTNYFYKLFVEELDNRNPFVRKACAEAIGKLDIVEGIDRLVSHLKTDPDSTIRMACAEALGNIKMASRSDVADALISKINDNDKCVGLACIKSLGRLEAKKAITPLLKAIKLEYAKKACIEAFGKLRAKKAISSITKSLNSTNLEIRRASAEALGKLRPSDEKAYRFLRKRLNDKIFTVRLACAEALAKLRKVPPNILKSYLSDLNDKDSPKHMESIMMLEKFNSIDGLEQVLQQHDDPFVRAACAESLGRLNASKAVSTLIDCLKDPYSSVCCESARSLGRLKATQSIPSLILSLDDIDLQVKIACARSLGKLQAKEAIPKFMEHLKTNNPQLCSIIVEALIIIDCSQNELQVAVNEDDQFWFVVLRKIIKLAPKKLKGKYRFLIQEFMPENKWGEMKVEEREQRRAVKTRRLDMLKEMMHSEVWEDREKAADVLNNILIAVSTKEEVLLRE